MVEGKYQILVAGPAGGEAGRGLSAADLAAGTRDFFRQKGCEAFCSLDPEDVSQADGVVFPGGEQDIDPAWWGSGQGGREIDDDLDRLQFRMVRQAYQECRPILGICRGEQLVSVFFGAKLIPDVPDSPEHLGDPEHPHFHEVYNVPGQPLSWLFGPTVRTNSLHHQAVGELPECLRVVQFWCRPGSDAGRYLRLAERNEIRRADSGMVIEAVQHVSYPFLGLQWHPEMGGAFSCRPEVREKIFRLFQSWMQQERDRSMRKAV